MNYAGIDLGGSKAAMVCVATSGRRHSQIVEIGPTRQPEAALDEMMQWLSALASELGPFHRIAIASAPTIDASGVISRWPNRPNWVNLPLALRLANELSCEVRWCDDGTAAATADANALSVANLVHFSLGTGVGGGIVVRNDIWPDTELGHLIVHPHGQLCSCGRRGCLQAYASVRALEREAPKTLEAETAWINQAAGAIALCTANLVELFPPEIVSFSGGLIGRFPVLPERIADHLALGYLKPSLKLPKLIQSPHGTGAALAGALLIAQKATGFHGYALRP